MVAPVAFLLESVAALVLFSPACVYAQGGNVQPDSTNQSWTVTTESSRDSTDPSRTTESHSTVGNRRLDKQSMQLLGPDGDYQPYLDTETETTAVSATTTRTVVRTYSYDGNKRRYLAQLTEEEAQTAANGSVQVVRTISNPDANGNLQAVRREVAAATMTGPNAQQVEATTYLADGNGGFTPSLQTRELQTRRTDHTVEVSKATLWPDADGNWTVHEVNQGTIKVDGKNRTAEDRLSRADLDGNLSEVSRTVSKQTVNAAGDQSDTVETYSVDVPGRTRDADASLHLSRRVSTIQKKDSTGETTEQSVEEPDTADSNGALQVTQKTVDVAQSGPSGTQHTKTYRILDTNGNLSTIAIRTSKSNAPLTQTRVSAQ